MGLDRTTRNPRSTQHADRKRDTSVGGISPLELTCILSLFYGAPLAYAPIRIFNVAGHSGWIAGMVSGAFGLLIALLWVKTSLRFPDKSLPEYAVATLGPVAGRLIVLVIILYLISETVFDARIISEAMVRLMPDTPLIVFIGMTLIFAVIVARRGPEVIGRMATMHAAVVVVASLFTILSVVPQVKPANFLPVLEQGWLPVLNASVTPTSFLGECIMIAILVPYLARPEPRLSPRGARPADSDRNAAFARSVFRASLFGTGLMWFYAQSLIVLTQGVIGAGDASRLSMPVLTLVRGIEIGTFVERIESALLAVWLPSVILKLCIFLYGAAQLVRHVAGAASFRAILLALAALVAPTSLGTSGPVLELIRLSNGAWAVYALISQIAPALLILGASAAKEALARGNRA